ncbi:MAG: hypothetical protein PUG67_09100 [Peptoniphilaceae bacterium]|nr:hypothetical protein [Peptoniphilaceae bacterium]MDY6018521.1 hypothetical protein [Anaerococcus sp.]
MKKKILILLIGIMTIFATRAYAREESLALDVYYFESIEKLDFYKFDNNFDDLNSTEKRRLATSLQAYAYAKKLGKKTRLEFRLGSNNVINFKDKGYYLLDFDKKIYGKNLISSRPLVLKKDGVENLYVKKEEEPINPSEDEKGQNLNVIFDSGNFDFSGQVEVGLFDSKGNLVATITLTKDNFYRHTFKNLDPKKKYSIWPKNLDAYYFYIDRINNTFYIKLSGKKTNNDKINKHKDSSNNNLSKDKSGEKSDKVNKNQVKNDSKSIKKLPQTGQLWLPVPFLIGIGIILIAYGRKNEE